MFRILTRIYHKLLDQGLSFEQVIKDGTVFNQCLAVKKQHPSKQSDVYRTVFNQCLAVKKRKHGRRFSIQSFNFPERLDRLFPLPVFKRVDTFHHVLVSQNLRGQVLSRRRATKDKDQQHSQGHSYHLRLLSQFHVPASFSSQSHVHNHPKKATAATPSTNGRPYHDDFSGVNSTTVPPSFGPHGMISLYNTLNSF